MQNDTSSLTTPLRNLKTIIFPCVLSSMSKLTLLSISAQVVSFRTAVSHASALIQLRGDTWFLQLLPGQFSLQDFPVCSLHHFLLVELISGPASNIRMAVQAFLTIYACVCVKKCLVWHCFAYQDGGLFLIAAGCCITLLQTIWLANVEEGWRNGNRFGLKEGEIADAQLTCDYCCSWCFITTKISNVVQFRTYDVGGKARLNSISHLSLHISLFIANRSLHHLSPRRAFVCDKHGRCYKTFTLRCLFIAALLLCS